jgi:hypothetical protein
MYFYLDSKKLLIYFSCIEQLKQLYALVDAEAKVLKYTPFPKITYI